MNRTRRIAQRRPAAWSLLALALVLVQLLGQWHLLAHGGNVAAPALKTAHSHTEAAASAADPAGHAQAKVLHGWLDRLFSGHHSIDCQLIDQLSAVQAPGTVPPLLAVEPAPSERVALWQAPPVTALLRVAFHARAPPSRATVLPLRA